MTETNTPLLPINRSIKVCGIREPDDVTALLQRGVTRIGLVFYPRSCRNVTLQQAIDLLATVDDFWGERENGVSAESTVVRPLQRPLVIVTVDMPPSELLAVYRPLATRTGRIQLHGNESVEYIGQLRKMLTESGEEMPEIVRRVSTPAARDEFLPIADKLLWEAAGELPGGNGVLHPWPERTILEPSARFIIAGGLTPDNVLAAIQATGVDEVDVSGGVELSPGVKSMAQVDSFIEAVRQYDRQNSVKMRGATQ